VTVVDVDSLPPTQYLILDVLAARWRTGEVLWTFPSKIRHHVEAVSRLGLVWWKSGIEPKTLQVGLTEAGRKATLLDTYNPPNGDEILWQYALVDVDEPDGLMPLDGTPRVVGPKHFRRPLQPVGAWEPAEMEVNADAQD
jgi:hypothetical protein